MSPECQLCDVIRDRQFLCYIVSSLSPMMCILILQFCFHSTAFLVFISLLVLHLCSSFMLPPHLHLTTSKVMVIVWWLRGNIIRTVLYIANVLPLQWAQLTKTVHTARLGLESFYVF